MIIDKLVVAFEAPLSNLFLSLKP